MGAHPAPRSRQRPPGVPGVLPGRETRAVGLLCGNGCLGGGGAEARPRPAQVEAKKAVPKEEHPSGRTFDSGNPQRTKKVFVGGLAPSVDENVLKAYFERFGEVWARLRGLFSNFLRPAWGPAWPSSE